MNDYVLLREVVHAQDSRAVLAYVCARSYPRRAMAAEMKKILFYDLNLYDAKGQTKRKPVAADPVFKLIKALPALDPVKHANKPTRYMQWNNETLLMEIFSITRLSETS